MKKIFLLLAFFTGLLSAKAQSGLRGHVGIKAGLNLYNVSGENWDDEGKKMRPGMYAGIFYRQPLGSSFSIQPEALYSQEGAKYENGDEKARVDLDYLNIPVMFQYHASGFHVETGPQLGFVLKGKAKYSDGVDEYTEDLKDEMKKTAFSWGFGAGYSRGRIGVGARYNLGLTAIEDYEDADGKSRGFQAGITVRIN